MPLTTFEPATPQNIDLSKFSPPPDGWGYGSNDFLIGTDEDGFHWVAKAMPTWLKDDRATHTILAERVTGDLYSVMGINVVPGKIIVHPVNGKAYWVMPDMIKNYGLKAGCFDSDIDEKIPNLYKANPDVVEQMQLGFFVALLTFHYDDIFKNRFYNCDKSNLVTELWLSDLGASLGSKASGGISGLLPEITPLQIYIILTQPFTQTCVNECFNMLLDYEELKMMKHHSPDDTQLQQECLERAIKDKSTLHRLIDLFENKITDEIIRETVANGFVQLPSPPRKDFQNEIEWRQKVLTGDMVRLEKMYSEADEFLKAHKDQDPEQMNPNDKKKFNQATGIVASYFVGKQLLDNAQKSLDRMRDSARNGEYSSEADFLTKTLLQRRENILSYFKKLLATPSSKSIP